VTHGLGKWRGNWRIEWVANTLHTTSELCVSSITTADAHISAASSRLNWLPCQFKWTRPFHWKTKSGFYVCAITFQTQSNTNITDKPYFNIISFKGCLREQHQLCTRTSLWSPQYRLRIYGIDDRMTSEWLILKFLEGHTRGLVEILSANLLEGNEKTVKHVRAVGQDSNRTSPECKSTTLLFGYYWYVVWAVSEGCQ